MIPRQGKLSNYIHLQIQKNQLDTTMQDYEKLGAFYLGKEVKDGEQSEDLVLYDSKDLTTHAVIIGMTGSGKTGLGTRGSFDTSIRLTSL